MANRQDLLIISFLWYTEPLWGLHKYGPQRWGICVWRFTLLLEWRV